MPTINENIAELQQKTENLIAAHDDIKNAIISKGGVVSTGDKFSDYPEDIETIKKDLTSISINENGTYRNGTLDTVTGTEYPIEIEANGSPIVSMTVNGKTVQDGTPTPTAPVDVVGVGLKSNNLFDKVNVVIGERVLQSSVTADADTAHSDYIDVTGISTLTVNKKYNATNFYFYADKTNASIGYVNDFTANVPTGAKYCRINVLKDDVDTIMLNKGSTPLPYEPYGYYLPTTINGNITNIYFGNYQSTRQIQKLVFDGTEEWEIAGGYSDYNAYFRIARFTIAQIGKVVCTHYVSPDTNISVGNTVEGVKIQSSAELTQVLIVRPPEWRTWDVDDFKAYLVAQYAAGTPVTIWYVLATPETTTSNEPLMKIGDYADQLVLTDSNITLPTIIGNNSVDYDLNLKPSSVSISYYKLGVNKTITSDTLPIELESNGDDATVILQGQSSQASTPTPTNPVDVNGVGERTAQLWDGTVAENMAFLNGHYTSPATSSPRNVIYIPAIGGETYTFSINSYEAGTTFQSVCSIDKPNPDVSYAIDGQTTFINHGEVNTFTRTIPSTANWLAIQIMSIDNLNNDIMINLGSTTLPYELYGYKIPILNNSITTNVYLCETQSTRRIKKLVLTGNETWERRDNCFRLSRSNSSNSFGTIISTHFKYSTPWVLINTASVGACVSATFYGTAYKFLMIRCDDIATTVADFKAYLATQYAAGTPVTVWYVLATEETGLVNEPLMKISDYTDTLSTTIPTIEGENILNINTTIKPSLTSITYTDLNTIGYDEIIVNVPNTYTNEDEGKVVNNNTLVAQTAMPTEITANDTYDTTLYNSIVVNVPTGGSTGTKNDVTFYDYDGTIVTSYSKDEFANLSALPANPTHEGLTAQGWNWSLADAKSYVNKYGKLDIGQMYVTDDGKTRIYITLTEGRISPILQLYLNANSELDIDWGDGSIHSTFTTTSAGYKSERHNYATAGDYVIAITVTTGSFVLQSSTSILVSSVLWNGNNNANSPDRAYNNSIQKIEIGTGITSIGNSAFWYCYSLQSITIPDTVTSIGNTAFQYCSSLSSITIPDGVTSISQSAFRYCHSLSSITIPNTVTSIGESAFNNCYSLSSITITDTVTSISQYVFNNCYSLSSVPIGNSVTTIYTGAFYSCYSLSLITIPDSVTSINQSAFSNCYSLSSITIPDTVTIIGESAFNNCSSLSSITIPDGVTYIRSNTFANCTYMESIKFAPTTPPAVSNSNAWGVPTSCTMIVPINTYSAYTTATNYPNSTTYTYLVFGTYESGVTLPSTSTDNYILTWYASITDAKAQTNPITVGNGNEVYARCLPFVTRTTDFVNNTTSLNGDVSRLLVYSNMKRCNVADDGTINAYDGDVGYTEDGSNGQVMVYVRKFYYKLDVSEEGSLSGVNIRKGKWNISDTPDTGYKLHPAFIGTDGTTELDYFLYGTFEAVGQDNNGTYSTNYNTTSYKMGSVGGNVYEPIGNLDRPTARTMAANRGTGWYQAAVRQTMAVQMLFAVEYGFNSQLTLGQGFTASSNEDPLNTGTTTGSISSGSTNTRIAVNYRGIENMWGNKWTWIDGLNMSSSTPYICDSYSFADNTTTGYTQIAFNCPATNYQSALGYDSNNDWVMLPSEASGANLNSAIGDYVYTSTGNLATLLGGDWSESTNAGVFCWNLSNAASGQFRRVGVRLMYIPS